MAAARTETNVLIPDKGPPPGWTERERSIATFILGVTAGLNLLDRQILAILIEPIKAEFRLSDTQIGLLTGLGFAIPYAFAAFPMAMLLERGVRKTVFAGALFLWSACTMLSGLAVSFGSLLAARLGVAVGESCAQPAQSSLLADLHLGRRLPRAMAILPISGAIGAALALMLGGFLTQKFGWRATLLIVGAPGVLIAAIMHFWFREPPRRALSGANAVSDRASLRSTFTYLWSLRSFRWIVLANAMAGLSGYVFLVWTPSLLVRIHNMLLQDIGFALGPISAFGMVAGAWLGGRLGARLSGRDFRWNTRIGGLACLVAAPAGVCMAFSPAAGGVIMGMVVAVTFNVVYLPLAGSVVQILSPPRMRGTAAAILSFWQVLAGVGAGPPLVGVLNDLLQPYYGVQSIQYSIAAASLASGIAGLALLRATAWVANDYARVANRPAG